MKKNDKAMKILHRLNLEYPDAHCELNHKNAFELLIATILSAQCTDVRVNMVTPHLFKKFPNPEKLSKASQADVEEIIKSTGFFKSKAQNIILTSKILVEKYNSTIPQTMDELTSLAGVGRKTANVVLGNAFNINYGIVVDTHVKRITKLLGLTKNTDPEKVEQDLMKLIPQESWTLISHLFIFLGRRTCKARNPDCPKCILSDLCPSSTKKK
jgi:endonuclease-3